MPWTKRFGRETDVKRLAAVLAAGMLALMAFTACSSDADVASSNLSNRRGTVPIFTPDGTLVARMKRSHKGHGRGMEVRRVRT
jgi:hypothetical protein